MPETQACSEVTTVSTRRLAVRNTTAAPQMRDQFRAYLGWIEAQLGDGRPWLLHAFSLADVHAYMNLWYTRSILGDADRAAAGLDRILAECPAVLAGEARIKTIGHGMRSEMTAAEALAVGTAAEPATRAQEDAGDPNGRGARLDIVTADEKVGVISGASSAVECQRAAAPG